MNHHIRVFLILSVTTLVTGLTMLAQESSNPDSKAKSSPAAEAAPAELPQSTFVWPSSLREGRDPFFPTSKRPYQVAGESRTNRASVVAYSAIKLIGISGTPQKPLAIINNRTFEQQEEGELTLPGSSQRVQIVVVEIGETSAVIEVDGQRVPLKLSPRY